MAKIISIEEALEGQILAETVSNSFGQELMPAGAVLEERHIRLLKNWNIRRIFVQDENSNEYEILEDDYNSAMEAINKNLFWEPLLEIEEDLIKSAYMRKAFLIKNKDDNN